MSPDDLAIYGGSRAVRTRYRERWRQIRAADMLRILAAARRDVSAAAKGDGPIADFEQRFAQMTGTKYALAMNSGTAALHSAYFAAGVVPGTEVIVPGYTFFATASPILQCGARPVFCDIDERTLLADAEDVERRITPRTRAMCVVHLWGNPAPLDRFVDIARRHRLVLVEDCSHAHGARYRDRPVGSWGDIGCFSLQGPKAVSGGEAGVAVTNDPALFDRMLMLGHYGRIQHGQAQATFDTDYLSLGVKYRPHLYAILLAIGSLSRLDALNRRRQHNDAILRAELADCAAVQPIETTPHATRGGFLEFILKYAPEHAGGWNRQAFVHAARAEGVPIAEERYARIGDRGRLLHESPIFAAHRNGSDPNDLPIVRSVADRLLTLPAFTDVPERFVRDCARALRKVAACAAAMTRHAAPAATPRRGSGAVSAIARGGGGAPPPVQESPCSMPDLAAVRGFLRTACDGSIVLDGLKATYVQAGAVGPSRVLYEIPGRNGEVLRLAARRVAAAKGRVIEEAINARTPLPPRSTGFTRAALYAPALDLLFQIFPTDYRLPSLPIAVDGCAMASVLEAALARRVAGARLTSVAVHVMRYKPERKCLLRYELAWAAGAPAQRPRVVWARVVRRSKFERIRNNLPRLHASAAGIGFDLPEPLGVVPELAMELFGPVAGVALFALTGRDDFAVLCRRVGESLRRFHALEVAIDETFDTREQAARLAENAVEFTWMLPAAATRIVALAREIDARLHATPSRLGVIHRDFHGDNVLVAGDTLALVDFEDCAMGEAADDVASNWAQLRWHEHRAPDRSARLAAARRAFLGGYLDAGDTRSAAGLPAYAAMHAFLYAHQCLRHPQDRTRRDDALVMLAACEQALDGDLT